jgi:hypothetical protein
MLYPNPCARDLRGFLDWPGLRRGEHAVTLLKVQDRINLSAVPTRLLP